MKNLFRVLLPLIVIIVFVNLYFAHPSGIQSVGNYPVWMKDNSGKHTDQTSGIAYVGESGGKKIFIAADDIGKLSRISSDETTNPPTLEISEINFSEEVSTLFKKFKKVDMEDVFYDKKKNVILLSIEGHEYSSTDPEIYRKKEGIYEITFNKDILTLDTLLTIKRLNLPQEIYKYTYDNIGFEGFAATDDYYFIGLENYQTKGVEFSDSTLLYIVNRKTNDLRVIPTRELKISTICGLYATDNFNLYGIDRNRRNMFYIKFNDDFSVNMSEVKEMDLPIPGHREINKIIGTAPEAITFDAKGNIYVVTDPWKNFYKPDLTDRKKLSEEELKNFNDFIPMMYKFKNNFQ